MTVQDEVGREVLHTFREWGLNGHTALRQLSEEVAGVAVDVIRRGFQRTINDEQRGLPFDDDGDRATVGAWFDEWIESDSLSPGSGSDD
jgi:hypothetical protein